VEIGGARIEQLPATRNGPEQRFWCARGSLSLSTLLPFPPDSFPKSALSAGGLDDMKAHYILGLVAACAAAQIAGLHAQPAPHLPIMDAQPIPRDGTYTAGDKQEFVLDHLGEWVRLRFSGSDEVFYLSTEAAPLGARVLKYDTGSPALRVAGWGGVTLYTPQATTGTPAEYSDVIRNVEPPPVAGNDVKRFAAGLAKEVDARTDFAIGFAADWDELSRSEPIRMLACDAMRNAIYALEQTAEGPARNTISDGLHIVRVVKGDAVTAVVRRGVLTVTIAPKLGASARPSSLAIERVLVASF
jgi:hypothetical protein